MNEEVRDIMSKVLLPAGPYWRDEGRLDNAYLWTEEERESVLFGVNRSRKHGMKYLRAAAAFTPEDTDVIVVPNIMAGAQIHGSALPRWRIVMAEFPNT